MGNISAKKGSQNKTSLDNIFRRISVNKEYILRSDLQKAWDLQIDKNLYADIETYLFSENPSKLCIEVFENFYRDICKEDVEKKVLVLSKLLNVGTVIPKEKLLQFVKSILSSILIIQESKSPKKFSSWANRISSKDRTVSLEEYATFFINKLPGEEKDSFDQEDLISLLNHLNFFLHMVLSRLYDTEEDHFYKCIFPKWDCGPIDEGKNLELLSILDLLRIMFLNLQLPCDFQTKWRILFSTMIHGESFSRLTSEIVNKGPTIIIIQDKNNNVFGGFASQKWSFGPSFFGDSKSFLFSLSPKMEIYPSTNFNENYQYLNVGQQTMPNGLGMGGRLEYFGLWIDAEFGRGYCSESCTTFRNYKTMSATREFEISHVEVWGVGPPPTPTEESEERSILNTNLDAKAMLEMSGKVAYSDGLREESKD